MLDDVPEDGRVANTWFTGAVLVPTQLDVLGEPTEWAWVREQDAAAWDARGWRRL